MDSTDAAAHSKEGGTNLWLQVKQGLDEGNAGKIRDCHQNRFRQTLIPQRWLKLD